MARSLKDKLYLSGMDGQAAPRWRAGRARAMRSPPFPMRPCWIRAGDGPAGAPGYGGRGTLLASRPFAELTPCAIDPLVRQVAEKRLCRRRAGGGPLGVTRMVCHGGFIPHVTYPVVRGAVGAVLAGAAGQAAGEYDRWRWRT